MLSNSIPRTLLRWPPAHTSAWCPTPQPSSCAYEKLKANGVATAGADALGAADTVSLLRSSAASSRREEALPPAADSKPMGPSGTGMAVAVGASPSWPTAAAALLPKPNEKGWTGEEELKVPVAAFKGSAAAVMVAQRLFLGGGTAPLRAAAAGPRVAWRVACRRRKPASRSSSGALAEDRRKKTAASLVRVLRVVLVI